MRIPPVVRYAATPALAAAFPIVSLYSSNPQYPVSEVGPCILLALVGGVACYLLLLAYYRDAATASVLSVPAVALFFLYGIFGRSKLPEVTERAVLIEGAVEVLYGLLWVGFAVCLLVARRRRGVPTPIATALLVVASSVVAMPTLALGLWHVRETGEPAAQPVERAAVRPSSGEPDIYYIVVDGYARADLLAELFGVDNSAFVEALRARGFFVADHARANYLQTHLSLASSLNLRYVDEVLQTSPSGAVARAGTLVRNSAVARMVKERGYRYVNVTSGHWMTSSSPVADVELAPSRARLREFQFRVLQWTPLRLWIDKTAFSAEAHRERVRFQFDALSGAAALPGPKFVFAHIVSPHPPFVFDRDGGPLDLGVPLSMTDGSHFMGSREQYRYGYSEQVRFLSGRLLSTLDAILAAYPPDQRPVIVLQSDHGSGLMYDHENVNQPLLRERAAILSAMLLPSNHEFAVSDSMTPVNAFRIVFNGLFDMREPLLPDRTYFVPMYSPAGTREIPASSL